MKNLKIKTVIYQLSALLIVMAAIIHSFDALVGKYCMILGTVGYAVTTFLTPYPGKSLKGKRLFNIQILAVLLMAVSAYLMYIDYSAWVITLFIAAIFTLYCAIVLPRVYKKEEE